MKKSLVLTTIIILTITGFGDLLNLGNINVNAEGTPDSSVNVNEIWIKESGIRIDIQPPNFQSMCPEVIRLPNGTFRIYYTETTGYNHMRILSAISTNGLDWQLEPGVRIDLGPSGAQDDWSTLSPEIVKLPNSTYRMFYDGYNGAGGAHATCILSAFSPDSYTWIKEPGRRVNYGNYGDWDHWAAGGASIVKLDNGSFRMYYHGKTDNVVRYRILSAYSKDGYNWTKESGLRIDIGEPYESRSVIWPEVIKLPNGQLKIYYSASDGQHSRILSAVSNNGIDWVKEPGIRVDKGGTYDTIGAGLPSVISISNYIKRMYYVGNDGSNPRILSALTIIKQPPVADAGQDQIVNEGDIVQFNGTESFYLDVNTLLLFDDFSSGLNQWSQWGWPRPYIDNNEGQPLPSIQINGDSSFNSGADSNKNIDYSNGIIIEADLKISKTGYHFYDSAICLPTTLGTQYNGAHLSVWLWGWEGTMRFAVDGNIYKEPVDTNWHNYKIKIRSDLRAEFYFDNNLKWISNKTINLNYNNMPVTIYGRNGFVDNVMVYTYISNPIIAYEWDFDSDGIYDYQETKDNAPDGAFDGKTSYFYGDNGIYNVTLKVTDSSGISDTDTCMIMVNNSAPTANIDSIDQPNEFFILPHQELTLYATFNDPGWEDTHISTWDFDDGTIIGGTLIEENDPPNASGSIVNSHIYDLPGDYKIILTVKDDDGSIGTTSIIIHIVRAEESKHIIMDYIQGLPDEVWDKNPEQRKNALINKFNAVDHQLDSGAFQGAINKLTNDIREKMDGIGQDWIIYPLAQKELYSMIDTLIRYLEIKMSI